MEELGHWKVCHRVANLCFIYYIFKESVLKFQKPTCYHDILKNVASIQIKENRMKFVWACKDELIRFRGRLVKDERLQGHESVKIPENTLLTDYLTKQLNQCGPD